MLFFLDNLLISQESVSLQCVFHNIRFKVNKGWSKALLLFICLYASFIFKLGAEKGIAKRIMLYKSPPKQQTSV